MRVNDERLKHYDPARALERQTPAFDAAQDKLRKVVERLCADAAAELAGLPEKARKARALRSLPAATLAEFWAELREVAAEIRPESVVVLQVDAAMRDAAEYAPDDLPDEIALKGRGGTDFRPGFEWLDEQGIRPAVRLYFTDMECSDYPDAEPPFPAIFCNWSDA